VSSIFSFDDFELDVDKAELRRAGVPIKTDALILRVLEVFVRNPGKIITKAELFSVAWAGRAVSDNSLTVAIARLRKAIDEKHAAHERVLTVYGRGYRFLRSVSIRRAPLSAAQTHVGVLLNTPPFVGREGVMALLRMALFEARDSSGGVIVLSGEGGIGKTRLAEVLAREAADSTDSSLTVAWGYCHELCATPPLWPVVGLLRDLSARLAPSITNDTRVQALLPELAVLLPDLVSTVAPHAEQPLGVCALEATSRHRIFDAVVRMLSIAAEQKPLLLVVDDLHRADEVSLDLLYYYLLPVVLRTRILLVATARSTSEAVCKAGLGRVLGHRNCTRISVSPLSKNDVAGYLSALFGDVDEALAREVYKRSEGNPFYMLELTRQLRQSQQLSVSALTIPSVALELGRQRLARLHAGTREVLTCAAVIGRSFGLPLLQAIAGQCPSELMASLDEAIASEVVKREPKSALDFTFTHDLLRAALYEALSPAQRRSWHLRIAQALEQRRGLCEAPIAELAYHAFCALPEGDLRKTVSFCIEAANAATRVHAMRDAAGFLQQAREALDLIDGASPRLRFGLLWRQAATARWRSTREFLPLAVQLVRLAREQGDASRLAQTALLLDPFPGFPRLPILKDTLADALRALPEDARCLRAALMARLASSVPRAYDDAESGTFLAQALELATTSPEPGDRFTSRFGELYLYGGPAHRPRAAQALCELQRLCNDVTHAGPLPSMLLDLHRALTAMQTGDVATAARALARCEACCREHDVELLWHVERFAALLRINQGDAVDGRDALLKLHRRAQRDDSIVGTELFCAYDRCVVLRAEPLRSSSLLALAPDAHDPPNLWALKVRSLAASGAVDEARSALARVAPERLARLPCDREYLGTLGALTRAALQLGALDYARVLYELLTPYPRYFAVNLAFYCEGSVSQLLGMLACKLGERKSARQHLEPAIRVSEKAGLWTCAADAQLQLEALLRRSAAHGGDA